MDASTDPVAGCLLESKVTFDEPLPTPSPIIQCWVEVDNGPPTLLSLFGAWPTFFADFQTEVSDKNRWHVFAWVVSGSRTGRREVSILVRGSRVPSVP
jgi:hypothetical protein